MLHGTLPRTYFSPGASYFGGYYGEDLYPGYIPLEDQYPRVLRSPWETFHPSSPSPLDLSLKPSSPRSEEPPIEVDDDEDRKDRLQKRLGSRTPQEVTTPVTLLSYEKFHLTPSYPQPPMTPPSTPSPPQCPRRRPREPESGPRTHPPTVEKIARPKKKHAVRRLKFDEDTSSPVSGTVILGPDEAVVTGDIDPAFNVVEITEEARAEIAKIENRLGPYQCKLCKQLYDDAFQLAQHRCSRIAHVEYRCPECDKRFSCPANLASHRRWHKPREGGGSLVSPSSSPSSTSLTVSCNLCDAKFTRQAALRKHTASQHQEANNNNDYEHVGGEEQKRGAEGERGGQVGEDA